MSSICFHMKRTGKVGEATLNRILDSENYVVFDFFDDEKLQLSLFMSPDQFNDLKSVVLKDCRQEVEEQD